MITLPLLLAVWLAKWFVVFLHHCSAWFFYLLGSVLLATAILSYLMHQSQGMEALQMVLLQGKTISLREGMKLRKTQLSYRLKKMNGNVRKDGKIWNTGVALLKYFAGLNSNQNGQYGQIYAEKFTSACLICKVFYGKMKAQ